MEHIVKITSFSIALVKVKFSNIPNCICYYLWGLPLGTSLKRLFVKSWHMARKKRLNFWNFRWWDTHLSVLARETHTWNLSKVGQGQGRLKYVVSEINNLIEASGSRAMIPDETDGMAGARPDSVLKSELKYGANQPPQTPYRYISTAI